jgi:RHS repeat-associated protein
VDDTGGVVKQIDYDSFGQVILDTNPGFDLPFGFAGGLCDGDTGLVRFGAREYDAEMGRWAAKDPILLKGGINVYSYARNDPVTVVDRSGLVTTVIITYDNGFGSHSALHVDNNGSPVLYDPGGSYGDGTRGTQDTFFDNEAALQPFIDFHETTGSRVDIFRFDTSPEEESSLAEAITQQGGMMPGFCAMATCSVLEESNAEEFWDLDGMYIFPGSLADSLRELLDRQGYCM